MTEALWKSRPVVAGAVGWHSGSDYRWVHWLVHSAEGASLAMRALLNQPDVAASLGRNGHQRVKDEFLITKNLKHYILLLFTLDHPDDQVMFLK